MENKIIEVQEAKEIFNKLMNKTSAFCLLAKRRAERELTPFMKEDTGDTTTKLITEFLKNIDNFCNLSLFEIFHKIQEPQLREKFDLAIQEQKAKQGNTKLLTTLK